MQILVFYDIFFTAKNNSLWKNCSSPKDVFRPIGLLPIVRHVKVITGTMSTTFIDLQLRNFMVLMWRIFSRDARGQYLSSDHTFTNISLVCMWSRNWSFEKKFVQVKFTLLCLRLKYSRQNDLCKLWRGLQNIYAAFIVIGILKNFKLGKKNFSLLLWRLWGHIHFLFNVISVTWFSIWGENWKDIR